MINSAQALNSLNDLRTYLLNHKNDYSKEIDALYKLENEITKILEENSKKFIDHVNTKNSR